MKVRWDIGARNVLELLLRMIPLLRTLFKGP